MMKVTALLAMAFRNTSRHRRRSLFSVVIVAFGVVAMTMSNGFIDWNIDYGRESMIRSHYGHIQIVRPGYFEGGLADPKKFLIAGLDDTFSQIQAEPKVRLLTERMAFNGLVSAGDTTIPFVGTGVDPIKESELSDSVKIEKGSSLSSKVANGVIVGQGLAANLGITVGDVIVLMATTPNGGMNAVEVVVTGLFSTIFKAYDDTALRVALPVAQTLTHLEGGHSWIVLLEDTSDTSKTLADLRRNYGDKALEFVPWTDLADYYNKTEALFERQANVIIAIIALLIVLSISNTLVMSIFERTSEIGTSMALGMNRRRILHLILLEGLLLGIAGALIGLLCSYALSIVITAIGIPMPPGPGMAHGYVAGITLTFSASVKAIIATLAATLVACALPAHRASRIEIVDALRSGR